MRYPYLITSDQHAHNWTQFARTGVDGVNSRLDAILNEMVRAHLALNDAGGTHHFYAGDLFHVRGKIEPSVFNPTFAKIEYLHDLLTDVEAHAIPGNHDLEGKHSDEIGNAMQSLSSIKRFSVCTKPKLVGDVLIVPWFQDLNQLREILKEWAVLTSRPISGIDVIIHAPVNGVIKGIPDTGLEAEELAAYGFRRVFAGHYHDHRVFCDGKVISVGATTHQTWNDPGTKAGFLLVYEDRIEHIESAAPKFVDLHKSDVATDEELSALVSGNYVRMKVSEANEAERLALQEEVKGMGALGVNIITEGKKVVSRAATTVTASRTVEASVSEYITNHQKPRYPERVQKLANELIAQARSEA